MLQLFRVLHSQTKPIDIVYPVEDGLDGLVPALDTICYKAYEAIQEGYALILLTDRKAGIRYVPVRYVLKILHQYHYTKEINWRSYS